MEDVREQPFRLTQGDPVISATDGVANQWSDIWKYQAPVGTALVLMPNHTFSAYLTGAAAEVASPPARIRIEKRDSSESDVMVVYGPGFSLSVREFQDTALKARLAAPEGGIIINEREFLVISVHSDVAVVAANSFFEMHIARVRAIIRA